MPNPLTVDFSNSRPRQEVELRPGSPQQEAIWAAVLDSEYHLEVNALAGVGKTYSLEEIAKRLTGRASVAYIVFSKANQIEAQGKMPDSVTVKTSHSFGFGAVRKVRPNVRVEEHKTDLLVNELNAELELEQAQKRAAELDEPLPTSVAVGEVPLGIRIAVSKLVGLCKNSLVGGRTLEDVNADALDQLAVTYGVDCNGDEEAIYRMVPGVLRKARDSQDMIDFDDMIWLPYVLNLPMYRFDVLMVDEAQDLNAAQQQLVLKLGKRIIYVGDRHQAIYGFRGADVTSMDTLKDTLNATPRGLQSMPLTVTRRCPSLVTSLAAKLVPAFEGLQSAPSGLIREVAPNTLPTKGDMVLCRVNAPLLSMAYTCLRNNIPARIQGRAFGQGLTNLVKKLSKPGMDVDEFLSRLDGYYVREQRRIASSKHANTIAAKQSALDDKVECIRVLCDGQDTVDQVTARIQQLFADVDAGQNTDAYVLLSTVHRAKGLEADTVHILEPDLLCKFGRQEWEKQQELNIAYVAITRAKRELIWQGKQPAFLGSLPRLSIQEQVND